MNALWHYWTIASWIVDIDWVVKWGFPLKIILGVLANWDYVLTLVMTGYNLRHNTTVIPYSNYLRFCPPECLIMPLFCSWDEINLFQYLRWYIVYNFLYPVWIRYYSAGKLPSLCSFVNNIVHLCRTLHAGFRWHLSLAWLTLRDTMYLKCTSFIRSFNVRNL